MSRYKQWNMGALAVVVLSAAGLTATGCASAPSRELMDARSAYQEAISGDAATYEPDELLAAKNALNRAEREHKMDPGSSEEKALAYVAQRKAQAAAALGRASRSRADIANAERQYKELAEQAQERLSAQGGELSQAQRELAQTSRRLVRAEDQFRAAIDELRMLATVREEAGRGMIITLPDTVLFQTGSAAVLPGAQRQLEAVARALKNIGEQRTVVIEGHTDSTGSTDFNDQLSRNRAESVRAYLIRQGVPGERLQAVGRGEGTPLASNDNPSGRAMNRRVEIVIPEAGAGETQQRPGMRQQGPQSRPSPGAEPSGRPMEPQSPELER